MVTNHNTLRVIKARTNNLKEITLDIPYDKLVCVTGKSGSGKSSLIYETIYAESQRAFFESNAINPFQVTYMEKPDVDTIENLKPSINISQTSYNVNPRSILGTVTGLSYSLRTLFALYANSSNRQLTLKANDFSFNNPKTYCQECKGTGEVYDVDLESIVDVNLCLNEGAISFLKGKETSKENRLLQAIIETHNIPADLPFKKLSKQQQEFILYNEEAEIYDIRYKTPKGRYKKEAVKFAGIYVEIKKKLENIDKPSIFQGIKKYIKKVECDSCNGLRMNQDILKIKINNMSISELEKIDLVNLRDFLSQLKMENSEFLIKNMQEKIDNLLLLNLNYLSLSRSIPSLSGGEFQRVRLANQVTSSLTGLICILDEPCRGLHPINVEEVINVVKSIVESGNSVISIEHNEDFISKSDWIVTIGPGSGPDGGEVIRNSINKKESYEKYAPINRKVNQEEVYQFLEFKKINYRNLVNQSVKIPVNQISFLTGISGAGKTSLAKYVSKEILKQSSNTLNPTQIKKVNYLSQSPIGKSSRSIILTYLSLYDDIRLFFEKEARKLGKNISSTEFSINVDGGRCELCSGLGVQKIDLPYLPLSTIKCVECEGKRFQDYILEVKYNNKNIYEVLELTISEAIDFFWENKILIEKFKIVKKLGLGYLKLGRLTMNLSGGESQRLKIASLLMTTKISNQMFIFDEPTSGLDETDFPGIGDILIDLKNANNTVLIIDHNLKFIDNYGDYIIDFGYKSGSLGGEIVSFGSVSEVFNDPNSSWYSYIYKD